ncbi:hypothetical protein MDA_GLEAN10011220 [Myotis davidii]|uniref:Uncharacterized protein n=1 Tax=Myotis davidii TaxID=225400 RepID=L5MGE0_MYODS|nr:hypothetical protein MDA_GLEAN10011220 [Myotis davidii]
MCPDWELNQQVFGALDDTQPRNEIPRLLMKPTQLCSIFKDSHDHRCHRGELRRLQTGTSLRAVVQYLLKSSQKSQEDFISTFSAHSDPTYLLDLLGRVRNPRKESSSPSQLVNASSTRRRYRRLARLVSARTGKTC